MNRSAKGHWHLSPFKERGAFLSRFPPWEGSCCGGRLAPIGQTLVAAQTFRKLASKELGGRL
jgi:hypothetical protein